MIHLRKEHEKLFPNSAQNVIEIPGISRDNTQDRILGARSFHDRRTKHIASASDPGLRERTSDTIHEPILKLNWLCLKYKEWSVTFFLVRFRSSRHVENDQFFWDFYTHQELIFRGNCL